jgi:hypothetical protein
MCDTMRPDQDDSDGEWRLFCCADVLSTVDKW